MTKKLEKKLMSEDRKNYLRKKKFRKIEILATQIYSGRIYRNMGTSCKAWKNR